ncbi:MAG: ATP-grasp domain-containing protein, partial [Polyangiaceae bacterium]|nr:ATP-grasp domain-containing protein [Polyangiaceae bacterium]
AIAVQELDNFLLASTGDTTAISTAFRESGAQAMATSGSELALTTTAHATHELGLPFYANMETINRCQSKDLMRAGYQAAGLAIPLFQPCVEYDQARAFAEKVGMPVVLKPANGWGQRGVSRVNSMDELERAFRKACDVSHCGGGAVIEECVVGHELSVNGWVENGQLVSYCVTDREVFPGNAPLGVMRSEITPSLLDNTWIKRAVEAARAGCSALGLARGPCYSQVAVTHDSAILYETAARLGGGFDADVTRISSGVDLYTRLLGVAFDDMELERAGEPHPNRPAIVRFLAPVPGCLKAVRGLEEVRNMAGVVDADVYPRPGDTVEPLLYAAKRVGHILATGQSRQDAIDRADLAEKLIHFSV